VLIVQKTMPGENEKKFLIITADTGGGHNSAAAAIAEGLKRFARYDCLVNITRAIEESNLFAQKLTELYNYLLRYHQPLMKYYYWAIERFRPNESNLLYRLTSRYAKQLFERYCPQIIVSVHPMTQHFLARVLRDLGLLDRIPIVTVVTDPCYGFWRGWACEDVSLYLVATEEARRQLIDFGVSREKIRICGIPIHPKFQGACDEGRAATRIELGLDPERFTVFVNAGWIGGGNIPRIFAEMVRGGEPLRGMQAIFLAGHNQELHREATALAARAPFPTRVLGYTDAMERVMRAADVMVSKLGGLTTFEALASRLPIIADTTTTPMPQESNTAVLIARHHAGVLLERASEVVPVIRRLICDPAEHAAMRLAAARLSVPDATRRVVDELVRKLDEATLLVPPVLSPDQPSQ
jgi:UDP-N-acetylglucosamine:LPS N-acetylglucosamine transferase